MIYLDYAATTPIDPLVAEAMLPWIFGDSSYGNPSSIHQLGRAAREAVDAARDAVAALLNCTYSEVTFTSSGTEADNLALFGTMAAALAGRNHLITTAIEHHAVLHAAHRLEKTGYDVTVVGVDGEGFVRMDELEAAITDRTALVSVMHANNEIGTIQPIKEAASRAHRHGALFHTDAVQTAGALPLDVDEIGCDLLTVSAHKIYGPKGAGALYVRTGTPLTSVMVGGSQERERRAGTENLPGLVGFGAAADLARSRMLTDSERLSVIRDGFVERLFSAVPGVSLNGSAHSRLPGNINISIEGIEGSTLLMNLDRHGICAASGAACSSGSIEPSHVLKALQLSPERAAGGIRLSLGRHTTSEELAQASNTIADIVRRLRRFSHVA